MELQRTYPGEVRRIDPTGLRDLAEDVITEEGLPRVMPAAFYAGTSPEERAWLGHRYGLYLLPTIELCDWLSEHIGDRRAIEIGAGNGQMAARLGIVATDSMLQTRADISALYDLVGQPPVLYGPAVRKLEASEAVRKLHPNVVIGAWVTHRWNPRQPGRGGNEHGPKMDWILNRIDEYILIGNERVHAKNPLWKRPHEIHHLPFQYSRATNGSPDFVAIWKA